MKKAQSFGERAMRKTRAVATLPEMENATAEFRTKCFWNAMPLRIAFTGLVEKSRRTDPSNAAEIQPQIAKDHLRCVSSRRHRHARAGVTSRAA